MFIISCIPEPGLKIYLSKKDIYISDNKSECFIKNHVLNSYRNFIKDKRDFYFNFDIVISFTDDIRKAETFICRDIALKVVSVLCSFIPEDFKIERVDDEMF